MTRIDGISPPMIVLGFNNDINTLERAVKERVFFVKDKEGQFVSPPKPSPNHFFAVMKLTKEALCELLPKTVPIEPLEFADSFRGRKKVIYHEAVDDLLRRSFCPRDADVKVFVKYEKVDFTRKSDPVPRVISPRTPRYNVELGCFLRPLEERIFKSLAKLFRHPTVIKGMNASTSGRILHEKWLSFPNPVALGLDASRFDQHVSVDALHWEHLIYLECFPIKKHKRKLARLLGLQLYNRCTGYTEDGRLKYKTCGGRMSGDVNTSLGNCVVMCSMVYAYATHKRVRVQLANNGDDCVVFLDQRDLPHFVDGLDNWFLRMGFNMVVETPCYTFEEIEFCQTHPVYVGPSVSDYLMVRHPKWGLAKDTVSVHDYTTPRMFAGWLHAVGSSGMSMSGGVPIFQSFYTNYLKFGKLVKTILNDQSWGVRSLSKGMHRNEWRQVLPATRASFYWAFGVTPDEQLVLEEFYGTRDLSGTLREQVSYQTPMPF